MRNWGNLGPNLGMVAAYGLRGNPRWWGGLYIGKVGRLLYANTLGTPLVRPVNAFVIAGVAYGLRFGRNFDLRAQLVEPVDRTSLQ